MMRGRRSRFALAAGTAAAVFVAAVAASAQKIPTGQGSQAAPGKPPTMEDVHKLHSDPKAYIAALDDPARDEYQKPSEVMAALGLKGGERIADIGAGSGYFTMRFARHVGDTGRVYAIDVSPDMILHLNRQVRAAGVDNVRTLLVPADDPLLADASVDVVFICNTWHHVANHPAYLKKLGDALKPGGRVVIIDFQTYDIPVGPPPEMKVPRENVVAEFAKAGFRLAASPGVLPYQYFLVFTPWTL
jgi:arsenite methyltransferase